MSFAVPLGLFGALGSCMAFVGAVTIIPFMPGGWDASAIAPRASMRFHHSETAPNRGRWHRPQSTFGDDPQSDCDRPPSTDCVEKP